MRKYLIIICFIISIFIMSGCLDTTPGHSVGSTFNITLNGDKIESDCLTADINKTRITIVEAGTYNVTGTLNDGQIVVEAVNCDVTLVLDNAHITCSNSAPIYIKVAKDTSVILKEGTENTLTDGTSYVFDNTDSEPDAALFSKDDLIVGGKGTLTINSNFNDALTSKDDLTINECKLFINSVGDGIKGKDSVVIDKAELTLAVKNDGIKTTNDVDLNRGYMTITDSIIKINSVDEAISVINKLTVHKSEITIDTQNNGMRTNDIMDLTDSIITIDTLDDDMQAATINKDANTIITVNGNVQQ